MLEIVDSVLFFEVLYWFLVADFVLLGWIGQKPVETPYIEIGMFATAFYFFFLIVLVPAMGILEYYISEDYNNNINQQTDKNVKNTSNIENSFF